MSQKTKNTSTYLRIVLILVPLALLLILAAVLSGRQAPADPAAQTDAATAQTTLPPPTENTLTPMDFSYEGDYLTCMSVPCMLGIDVSTHQKQIDWQQVKDAGIEFVMIRLAYRGSVEGLLSADEWAQTNYAGAKAAGLKVGGYIFTQAISVEEAVEDARYAMDIIRDWELDMPLVYDWELIDESYRNANVDARTLTDCTKAFCETVEAAGYDAMIYFNPGQSRKQMYLQELTDYGFWLAMYSDHMDYEYKVDMWQYTCEGSVPGISGNVDINLYFLYDDEAA